MCQNNGESKEKVKKDLISVCDFICDNHKELRNELQVIGDMLRAALLSGVANEEAVMLKWHLDRVGGNREYVTLKKLREMVEKIGDEAYLEFVQNVDYVNMYYTLIDQCKNKDFLNFVCKVDQKRQYFIYQLERIVNGKFTNKRVAILEGMVIYC